MELVTTRKQAIKTLIKQSKHIRKDMYFHPFKYEIERLMEDLISLEKRITSADLKEIYFCMGFLKADKHYQSLDLNDFAR